MNNYYDDLGIKSGSSLNEIKSAFRKLARKHHPDLGGDVAEFRKVDRAYKVLSDEDKRREYDRMGHETYKSHQEQGGATEDPIPNWSEYFEKMFSTETLADRYFGDQGYSYLFTGGEVEDPKTGDIYHSAEDIRIAKMERAIIKLDEIITKLQEAPEVGDWPLDRVERLEEAVTDFYGVGWINENEFNKFREVLSEYKNKFPELEANFKKEQEQEKLEGEYGVLQEKDEVRRSKREAETKSIISQNKGTGDRGHRKGKDSDSRKEWRREARR